MFLLIFLNSVATLFSTVIFCVETVSVWPQILNDKGKAAAINLEMCWIRHHRWIFFSNQALKTQIQLITCSLWTFWKITKKSFVSRNGFASKLIVFHVHFYKKKSNQLMFCKHNNSSIFHWSGQLFILKSRIESYAAYRRLKNIHGSDGFLDFEQCRLLWLMLNHHW